MHDFMGAPAARYNNEYLVNTSRPTNDGDPNIVWIGFTAQAVTDLIDLNDVANGELVRDQLIETLQGLVDDDTITIAREWTVTATVTMTAAVMLTVEARNEEDAAEMAEENITDGEGLDDFMHDAYVETVQIEDVESS